MRCLPVITAVTLVTLFASYPFVTNTYAGFSVALLTRRTDYIALARCTLDVRITPEIRLAFVASSSTETRSALAIPVVGITPVFGMLKKKKKGREEVKNDRINYRWIDRSIDTSSLSLTCRTRSQSRHIRKDHNLGRLRSSNDFPRKRRNVGQSREASKDTVLYDDRMVRRICSNPGYCSNIPCNPA